MSIASALNIALSGLDASGKLAEITSGNLANALTDGYGSQSVTLSSSVVAGYSSGVAVTGVYRASSPELTSARRLADGEVAGASAELEAISRLEQVMGAAGGDDTLANRLDAFEGSLRQLAETPELAPRQGAAVAAAGDVAVRLNQISTESARVRSTADAEIARQVSEVNGALGKIARLNRQIQIFSASGRDTANLIDERERLIDRVASIVPIREQRRDDGVVAITTQQGLPLADTRAQQIAFTATPIVTAPMRYDNGAGALSGLTLNGVDITPGGPGTQAIDSGGLAGLFAVRDRIAPEFSDRADALAADLIGRLSAAGLDPTVAAGAPGLFTDDGGAYDPTVIEGLAGRIRLNTAVDPAQGGDPARLRDGLGAPAPGAPVDGTLPRAMLDALTVRAAFVAVPGLHAGMSVREAATGLMELTALGRVSTESEFASLSGSRQTLALAEADRIGVDTDDEMRALIQIEQAYSANVQVIQTASRMLDRLMEI